MKTIYTEQDGWRSAHRLIGNPATLTYAEISAFRAVAKRDWISAKARDGKKAETEVRRWIRSVNPSQCLIQWNVNVNDDSIVAYYLP